ncbi:MAG TPA: MurR/RpiR family transcriptional regulator [Anaerolineae bacterium]|nr:MurR/RpiR family transcriptional regulator [Anaerolineae bacterium]HIQ06550.1 MurR/RpiR family transcriptional regulator [Anaerolineae bacterium]
MFQERIREAYDSLPRSYRRIADFLLNNYQQAAFMTASQLAKQVNVDTATVVRFSQRLGYAGYPALIREVRAMVSEMLRTTYEPFVEGEPNFKRFSRTLNKERDNVLRVLQENSQETLDAVIEHLKTAGRVFVVADGPEAYLGRLFAHELSNLGITAVFAPESLTDRARLIVHLKEGDVVLGIQVSPRTVDVANVVKQAREQGVSTIGVVGYATNPLSRAAELVFSTPSDAVGPEPALGATLTALQGIYQLLSADLDTEEKRAESEKVANALAAARGV